MKKRLFKKAAAVVTSALVAASAALPMFSATVGAAEIGSGTSSSSDTTLTIPKGITVKNGITGNYYSPNITYTYTIAPVAPIANATVKDSNNFDYPVEIGVQNGVTLQNNGDVVFTSHNVGDVTPAGVEITANLSLNVNLSAFSKPGVYRYKIEDVTATSTLYNVGIVRPDDYDKDRFLDVYIKNGGSSLTVAGYTLTTDNLADTTNAKDPGFVKSVEALPDNHGTDTYRTYDVRIEKLVTGDMGDKTHPFPFEITIENDGLSYHCGDYSAVTSNQTSDLRVQNVSLKNGDVFYIRGLSPRAQVSIKETNNTSDTYKVKIEGRIDVENDSWTELVTSTATAPNADAVLAQGYVSTYVDSNDATSVDVEGALTNYRDVRYTNDLASISPTGVVLRFAPFIVLAGFGVLLFAVSRRNKGRKDETDMI